MQTFTVASRSAHFDFVEALQYSKERGVVMVGKMCDRMLADKLASNGLAPTTKVNAIGKFYKPWFFKHAESFLDVEKQNALDYHSVKSHDAVLNYLGTLYSAPSLQTPALKPLSATVRAPSLHQELIPLRDYFHRHTKAIFWELQDIVPFGNDAWFRYLFGWAVPPHISLLKLTTTESLREMYDKAHVIQVILASGV